MTTGPDGETLLRLLLLEAKPKSLAAVRDVWPEAEIVVRPLDQGQGVADQISREKVQIVICDLEEETCPGLNALQQIRRVHSQLPLIAVLLTPVTGC
jgi:DNA-binding NtrC family response regulator